MKKGDAFIVKIAIINALTVAFALHVLASDGKAEPVQIKSGNVIGSPLPGEMPHHMELTQRDFSKLVEKETDGEVIIDILEDKRPDIPVFAMPEMTRKASVIQATAVPSFFLPRVGEMKIFEIPYLFRNIDHARRYPNSGVATEFSAIIEERYDVKVLGHFLVAHHVAITSTNRPIVTPGNFAGRFINDDFESFAPMWENIKPAMRYQIGYTDAVAGALHSNQELDTSIGLLQNLYPQKQYTKFHFATIAPSFYTFFYTYLMNVDVWNSLSESQQAGVLRAIDAAQQIAFDNEQATAIYHQALNRSLGMSLHHQTPGEQSDWQAEFSHKVQDGILEASNDPERLAYFIQRIRAL